MIDLSEVPTKDLKLELAKREYERRNTIKNHIIHDEMLVGEVMESLSKNNYVEYGDYDVNYYDYSNDIKVAASKLRYYNTPGSRLMGLIIKYKGHEFFKDRMEAFLLDMQWKEFLNYNGWAES